MQNNDMPNTYDQTPYPRHAYGFTHPDRLATLATLHGLEPPPIERARVLEVGCARGANLVPMAYALPAAELIGIDLSERQIAEGRQFAAAMGFKNVRLEQRDLATLGDTFGRFDYIIAHGVHSWVPPAVGQALLDLCGRLLTDNGVALVSYNAYPGCHLRQMVRAMGQFHTRGLDDPQQRVGQLHALMQLLVRFAPDDGSAYKRILRSEADRLADLDDGFLLHDVLEEENHPVYFHEFIEGAAACGLQYVCEALPADRRRTVVAPEVYAKLASEFDRIELEQHLDFLDGTSFRRTVLCRSGHAMLGDVVTQDPQAIPLDRLLLTSPAKPLSAAPELHGSRPEEFVARKNRVTATLRCDGPIEKAALTVLGEIYPATIPLEELLTAAAARLGRAATAEDRREVRALVAGGFPIGVIELHRWQPRAVSTVSRCPEASPVARFELAHGLAATTLWHDRFVIDDPVASQLVIQLDGRADRQTLLDRIAGILAAQECSASGPSPHWPASNDRDQIAARLELALNDLAWAGMLIG